MLNADSSTEKSESELQSRTAPPTIPSVAEFFWIECTAVRIVFSEVPGKARSSSWIRKLDSPKRPASPSSDSARKSKGTNESSAK